MAEPGLTYYDQRNYVETQLRRVSYSTDVLTSGFYGQFTSYMYTRNVTKTYKFTGLSRSTALRCIKEKEAMYTRDYGLWKTTTGNNDWHYYPYKGGQQSCASVSATRLGGGLWDVEIQVNETCFVYSKTHWTQNLDDLFSQYYNWSYDDYE